MERISTERMLPIVNASSAPLRYAGFWCRATATAVDGAIISIVMSFFSIFLPLGVDELFAQLTGLAGGTLPSEQSIEALFAALLYNLTLLFFVSLFIAWIYSAYFESSLYQATPGKRYMGIRVTTTTGARVSFLRATVRHLAKNISLVLLCIGYLVQPFTQHHQALHDIVSSSLVVEEKAVDAQRFIVATIFSIAGPLFVSIVLMAFGVIF